MRFLCAFPDLERLVIHCGAPRLKWRSDGRRLRSLEIPDMTREITREQLAELTFSPQGLLMDRGQPVFLYIKDVNGSLQALQENPSLGYKLHFSDCATLQSMKTTNRFERYVVAYRTDGTFPVSSRSQGWGKGEPEEGKARLLPCRYCLSKLNYRDYNRVGGAERGAIVHDFDPLAFLEEYRPHFSQVPSRGSDAPADGYPPNWSELSIAERRSRGWRCDQCGLEASAPGDQKLLHVHHRNGVKGDLRPENLQVLCSLCHAQIPHHQHMKVPPADRWRILELRRRQRGTGTMDR